MWRSMEKAWKRIIAATGSAWLPKVVYVCTLLQPSTLQRQQRAIHIVLLPSGRLIVEAKYDVISIVVVSRDFPLCTPSICCQFELQEKHVVRIFVYNPLCIVWLDLARKVNQCIDLVMRGSCIGLHWQGSGPLHVDYLMKESWMILFPPCKALLCRADRARIIGYGFPSIFAYLRESSIEDDAGCQANNHLDLAIQVIHWQIEQYTKEATTWWTMRSYTPFHPVRALKRTW